MANPEIPKPIDRQVKLYKLPKIEIDWNALPSGSVEVKGATSFNRALHKILAPANLNALSPEEKMETQRTVSQQIAAIEALAVRAGFDISLARDGDRLTLENGVIYLDLKRGAKAYAMRLDKTSAIKAGYEEMKPEVVVKSRRAWESLKEAFERGIISEILPALAGGDRRAGSFENRVRVWKEVMGQTEIFKGTAAQNRTIVEYIKAELKAGRTLTIAPPAAPQAKKKKIKVKSASSYERLRKEGRWPAKDAYMEWLRDHPLQPETTDPLKDATNKITVLLGPKIDALNKKIDEYEELIKRAKANMRGGADANMTRGSLWAALNKASEGKDEIFKLTSEVKALATEVEQIRAGIEAQKPSQAENVATILRIQKSLGEVKTALDEQYRMAEESEHSLLDFLKQTQITQS